MSKITYAPAPSVIRKPVALLWWLAAALLVVTGAYGVDADAASLRIWSYTGALVLLGLVTAWKHLHDTSNQTRSWPYVLLLAAFWIVLILCFRSIVIEGRRYFFLVDDMMISMRYARNLVDGLGLVWNPGERIEGYTDPLWTLLMAVVHLLPLPDRLTSLPIMIVSVIAGAACLPLSRRWAQALGADAATQALVLFAITVNAVLTASGVLAFEQTAITALMLLALIALLRDIEQDRFGFVGYACLGLIPLIRMDAAVLSVSAGLWVLFEHPQRLRVVWCLALAMLPSLAATLARYAYYGDWLPNTYYLKTVSWPGRERIGLHYLAGFLRSYIWAYALIALAMWRGARRWSAAWHATVGVSAAQLLYGAYVGGDFLGIYRILTPAIPLLITGSFAAGAALAPRKILAAVAVLLAVVWARPAQLISGLGEALREDTGNIELGLTLNREIPTARVADGYAGSPFYFAPQLRGIDMLGKMDRHIAHLPVTHGGTIPGHNKFDFDYSIGVLKPDYVVSIIGRTVPLDEIAKLTHGDWAAAGYFWSNPAFRQYCLPHPMPWPTWRIVYRCEWNSTDH